MVNKTEIFQFKLDAVGLLPQRFQSRSTQAEVKEYLGQVFGVAGKGTPSGLTVHFFGHHDGVSGHDFGTHHVVAPSAAGGYGAAVHPQQNHVVSVGTGGQT